VDTSTATIGASTVAIDRGVRSTPPIRTLGGMRSLATPTSGSLDTGFAILIDNPVNLRADRAVSVGRIVRGASGAVSEAKNRLGRFGPHDDSLAMLERWARSVAQHASAVFNVAN